MGDLDRDGREELLSAPGPDPSATSDVSGYAYDGASLVTGPSFRAFASMYGATVAGSFLAD